MPKFTVHLIAALALAGVSLGECSHVSAQTQPADSRPEPITESEPLPIPGDGNSGGGNLEGTTSPSPVTNESYPTSSPTHSDNGGFVDSSHGGQYGYGPGYMPNGGTPIRHKEWYGYENQGPWQRVIRRPIYRVPVSYARYWPSSYYTGGYNPAARYAAPMPMVYQPTDTTQLGFTYQRVPQWQPRQNAIPGAPWPPNWHYTIPVRYGVYEYPNAMAAQGQYAGNVVGTPVASYPMESGVSQYPHQPTYGTPHQPQYNSQPQYHSQPAPPAVIHPPQPVPTPSVQNSATPLAPAPATLPTLPPVE